MPSNGTAPETGGGSAQPRGPIARALLADGVIVLGQLTPADALNIAVACSDSETQRWLPLPDPYTAEDALTFVRRQDTAWAVGSGWIFAVRCVGQDPLIGTVGVHDQGSDVVTLGYWTAPGHRRLGYAARAVRLAALFAFDNLHARRVEILVDKHNAASRATACRAGAREDGHRLMAVDDGLEITAVIHVLARAELG